MNFSKIWSGFTSCWTSYSRVRLQLQRSSRRCWLFPSAVVSLLCRYSWLFVDLTGSSRCEEGWPLLPWPPSASAGGGAVYTLHTESLWIPWPLLWWASSSYTLTGSSYLVTHSSCVWVHWHVFLWVPASSTDPLEFRLIQYACWSWLVFSTAANVVCFPSIRTWALVSLLLLSLPVLLILSWLIWLTRWMEARDAQENARARAQPRAVRLLGDRGWQVVQRRTGQSISDSSTANSAAVGAPSAYQIHCCLLPLLLAFLQSALLLLIPLLLALLWKLSVRCWFAAYKRSSAFDGSRLPN